MAKRETHGELVAAIWAQVVGVLVRLHVDPGHEPLPTHTALKMISVHVLQHALIRGEFLLASTLAQQTAMAMYLHGVLV